MNQKDYKEIAKMYRFIINKCVLSKKELDLIKMIINNQADYFERESNIIAKDKYNPDNINEFNKQHFLKMCGVK